MGCHSFTVSHLLHWLSNCCLFLCYNLGNSVLGKGGYVFGGIGFFVCLSVSIITQNVKNRL